MDVMLSSPDEVAVISGHTRDVIVKATALVCRKTNRYSHSTLQKKGLSGRVFLGCVFKNAAQNGIKPRFLKTGLKGARPSRVLHAGP